MHIAAAAAAAAAVGHPQTAIHTIAPPHLTPAPCALSVVVCFICWHLYSGNQLHSRRGALNVHEWSGTFKGSPASFKMTSVIGHVYSLDFPPKYNSWDRVDPLELFEAETVKQEANPKV